MKKRTNRNPKKTNVATSSTGTKNANWWQYSRWVYLIGRNMKQSGYITDTERTAIETFIQRIGNPETGTRPWLADRLRIKDQRLSDEQEDFEEPEVPEIDTARIALNQSFAKLGLYGFLSPANTSPTPVIDPINPKQDDYSESKMLQLIGRDLKKIPLNDQEKEWCDELFLATDPRRFGYHSIDGYEVEFTVKLDNTEKEGVLVKFDGKEIETESNGVALFSDVEAGKKTVTIDETDEFEKYSEELTISEETKKEISLTAKVPEITEVKVTLNVKDEGSPVGEGISLNFNDSPYSTNSEGKIVIESVAPGNYDIHRELDSTYQEYNASINVTSDSEEQEFEVSLIKVV